MRMNVDNYRCILSKSGLNDAEVCKHRINRKEPYLHFG